MPKRTYLVKEIDKRLRRAAELNIPTAIGGGTVLAAPQHALDGPEHTEAIGTDQKLATAAHSGLLPPLSGDAEDRLAGDGTWVAGGGGHTIEEDGTPLSARSKLNFATGIVATDDAGNDETDVNIDFGEGATQVAAGDHTHAAGDSSRAVATGDLTVTGTAQDVAGATLSLVAGTYIVTGVFDVTDNASDRSFEGILDVDGVDEADFAILTPAGITGDRLNVIQVWRIVLASPATVKLQARYSGGSTGDFTVNAANTAIVAYVAGGSAAAGYSEGTAFPGSPATNAKFYRTDLNLLFFYDGTRWLTTTLYTDPIPPAVALPIGATTSVNRVAMPLAGSMAIWVETFWMTFLVAGGTALGASHKWVCTLIPQPATSAAIGTITINSGASDAYRQASDAINAVVTTSDFQLQVIATKTGTPGTLYSMPRISYRLIGT